MFGSVCVARVVVYRVCAGSRVVPRSVTVLSRCVGLCGHVWAGSYCECVTGALGWIGVGWTVGGRIGRAVLLPGVGRAGVQRSWSRPPRGSGLACARGSAVALGAFRWVPGSLLFVIGPARCVLIGRRGLGLGAVQGRYGRCSAAPFPISSSVPATLRPCRRPSSRGLSRLSPGRLCRPGQGSPGYREPAPVGVVCVCLYGRGWPLGVV